MDIDLPGVGCGFDDLPLGGFFMARRSEPVFGMCVTDGHTKSAIVFSSEKHGRPVSLAVGGLPNDLIVSFPRAVMRGDLSSIADNQSVPGAIISAAGEFYMRAYLNLGDYYTFNVRSGALERPPAHARALVFAGWRVGFLTDGKFDPIFTFPFQPRN
ncbi:hypothetical protein MTX26_27740 [Bradyrhizobium sp. ISRA443]|uniref:hypothetical protein n=1 Tax=unclassified Bradyrhizobium TaxID=2631580 RepID=UPI002479E046|nr:MULTISPECIES: hypothetical protein [unclassified Bradyrhizobium]WGR93508.1 hypothetical protein MTX20_02595 [Bradyrhizobium sp. ISRA435]WGR98058.1 hypothetical protein MTX23_27730 [Bradyrhizobium sp. ISRA436]WGS04947.1 hypothetical protein MTX18_27735 [Bradyrhizobium sp. ISRA437]WGS11831.1 hypothetical protein MTX26_27740 [Bradyrhizobium sp. ISRA443]